MIRKHKPEGLVPTERKMEGWFAVRPGHWKCSFFAQCPAIGFRLQLSACCLQRVGPWGAVPQLRWRLPSTQVCEPQLRAGLRPVELSWHLGQRRVCKFLQVWLPGSRLQPHLWSPGSQRFSDAEKCGPQVVCLLFNLEKRKKKKKRQYKAHCLCLRSQSFSLLHSRETFIVVRCKQTFINWAISPDLDGNHH